MITVTLYRQENCAECDRTVELLKTIQETYPHQLVQIDITIDPALQQNFAGNVPAVQVGPYRLVHPFSEQDLKAVVGAAFDRDNRLQANQDKRYQQRLQRGHSMNWGDRLTYWISHYYLAMFMVIFFTYTSLPFLAPVFMKLNLDIPAKAIYTIYSPLCHQLTFRSWFLFGEQAYYPRALSGIQGVITYEQLTGSDTIDVMAARSFIGNEKIGYKVALCERDIAMYGSLFIFVVFFSLNKSRIKSLPWYIWLVLGLGPIGLDGVSQLPSLMTTYLPSWMIIRESTPLLRTLTGVMFGIMTGWYLFPLIEESMRETRGMLVTKMEVIKQTQHRSVDGNQTN
jgi:uncharacterized membrane protein